MRRDLKMDIECKRCGYPAQRACDDTPSAVDDGPLLASEITGHVTERWSRGCTSVAAPGSPRSGVLSFPHLPALPQHTHIPINYYTTLHVHLWPRIIDYFQFPIRCAPRFVITEAGLIRSALLLSCMCDVHSKSRPGNLLLLCLLIKMSLENKYNVSCHLWSMDVPVARRLSKQDSRIKQCSFQCGAKPNPWLWREHSHDLFGHFKRRPPSTCKELLWPYNY